jgi:hypothetical protein
LLHKVHILVPAPCGAAGFPTAASQHLHRCKVHMGTIGMVCPGSLLIGDKGGTPMHSYESRSRIRALRNLRRPGRAHPALRLRRVADQGAAPSFICMSAAPPSFLCISGVLPEKARLDAAGAIKVNAHVKRVYCYQPSYQSQKPVSAQTAGPLPFVSPPLSVVCRPPSGLIRRR